MEFEPITEREKIIHAEVIKSLDEVVEARRSVSVRLPQAYPPRSGSSWWSAPDPEYRVDVSVLGREPELHALLVAFFATFVALLLFLTAAMDNPFRGEVSVSSESFQDLLDKVMSPPPSGK